MISDGLWRLVEACWAKIPQKRPMALEICDTIAGFRNPNIASPQVCNHLVTGSPRSGSISSSVSNTSSFFKMASRLMDCRPATYTTLLECRLMRAFLLLQLRGPTAAAAKALQQLGSLVLQRQRELADLDPFPLRSTYRALQGLRRTITSASLSHRLVTVLKLGPRQPKTALVLNCHQGEGDPASLA
jgi:hypothetical protein